MAIRKRRTIIEVARRGRDGVDGTGSTPIDTDATLAANSDVVVPSQKAVKTYAASAARVDPGVPGDANELLSFDSLSPSWVDPGMFYASNYSSVQDALDASYARTVDGKHGSVVQLGQGEFPQNDTLVVPSGNALRGASIRSTAITAGPSFPDNKTLVQLGRWDQQVEHGMVLEDLTVDCKARTGSTAVESETVQEPGALRRMVITQYKDRGIYIHPGDDGRYVNHFLMEDLEVFGTNAGTTNAAIDLGESGNSYILRRSTINCYAGGTTSPVAIRCDDAPLILEGVHFEQHDIGLDIYRGTGSKGTLIVMGLTGHPSMGTMIKAHAGVQGVVMNMQSIGATAGIWSKDANQMGGAEVARNAAFYILGAESNAIKNVDIHWNSPSLFYQPESFMLINCGSGNRWIVLPNAQYNKGKQITYKKVDSSGYHFDLVNGDASSGIDGVAAKQVRDQWSAITVLSDGTKWLIVNQMGTIANTY